VKLKLLATMEEKNAPLSEASNTTINNDVEQENAPQDEQGEKLNIQKSLPAACVYVAFFFIDHNCRTCKGTF